MQDCELGARSCAIDFQTESVLALYKKLKVNRKFQFFVWYAHDPDLSDVCCLPLLFLLNSIGFPILEASSPITRSLMGSWKIWGLFDRRPKRGDEGIIFGAFFEALLEKKRKKYKNIQTRLIFFLENVDDDGLANSQPTKFHHYWIFLDHQLL